MGGWGGGGAQEKKRFNSIPKATVNITNVQYQHQFTELRTIKKKKKN